MKQIYETLCGICGAAHVLVREPMSRHTTFRTGGPADLLVQPEAEQIAPISKYVAMKRFRGPSSEMAVTCWWEMAASAVLSWKLENRCQTL